jgi:hypothetical protein
MFNGIRVFDSILDGKKNKDTVSRNAADYWKAFCHSAGWDFSYERIHSLTDLEFFMSRKIKEDVIIFSGHGYAGKENENGFHLSNKEVYCGQPEIIMPMKNHGKTVIFSSCLMGKNDLLAQTIKSALGADYLFAYKHLMYDRFCFLNESILLTTMEYISNKGKQSFTDNDFIDFQVNTEFLKNMNGKHVKSHSMLMF